MPAKNITLFIISCFLTFQNFAQMLDLEEKKPVLSNGIEYGYIIKNEQVKAVKDEEYSRYEITLYASNKSGCTKLYADRETIFGESPNMLVNFECNNATGKRLTSKGGKVYAKLFYIPLKTTEKDSEGKSYTKTTSTKAGYIFRNGDTIQDKIIVIVPRGERPVMRAVVNSLQELN
ncbi:MAG: hypothetical protein ABIQ56_05650 [Chitinophagaceae bacterium]